MFSCGREASRVSGSATATQLGFIALSRSHAFQVVCLFSSHVHVVLGKNRQIAIVVSEVNLHANKAVAGF